jgi:hypothetical protein
MVARPLSSQHAGGGQFSASWKNARILPVFAQNWRRKACRTNPVAKLFAGCMAEKYEASTAARQEMIFE